MSLGPTPKEEVVEIGVVDKLRHTTKKMTEAYFMDPLHYLFYTALGATMVGLFFGMSFSLPFYLILGMLAVVKVTLFMFPEVFNINIEEKRDDNI